ncbi:MAG: acylphosphatase [Alkalispirochaetaceae bacterium]
MAEKRAVKANVKGRVQGVGFRYSTQRQARRLGVNGWVRNERDGTVTVVAEGPKPAVDEMLRWLNEGPGFAKVAEVTVNDYPYEATYSSFTIEP